MYSRTMTTTMAALAVSMFALAAHASGTEQDAAAHDHAHAHEHDEAAAKQQIYSGYFEDSQIAPRPLSDWQGEWQSVFPLLEAGQLDAVMADKAAHGDKTAEEYTEYYRIGYATDVDRLDIEGDMVTFHRGDAAVSGRYADDGYEILTYEKGNRGVRFIFRKVEGDADAPGFIQFSDHKIAPEVSDHYHLYWGEDRAEILKELTNWPTYYPAALSTEGVVSEMLAH